MTLNATIVVQIFNFLITWCVVRYLFIQPAIKIRDSVYGALQALSGERDQLHEAVRTMRDQEYRAWHVWYLQVNQIMKERYQPVTHREPVSVRVSTPEIPAHEIEKTTERLTALVLTRLEEKL